MRPPRNWTIRWHIARVTVGNTSHFAAGVHDGLRAFRREFSRTWGERCRAADRDDFYRRRKVDR